MNNLGKASAIIALALAGAATGQKAPEKSVAQLAKEVWDGNPKLVFDGTKNGLYAFHYSTDKGIVSIKAACSHELVWADDHTNSFSTCPGMGVQPGGELRIFTDACAVRRSLAEIHDAPPFGYFYVLGSAASLTIYFVVQNDKWRPNDVPAGCAGPRGVCCAGVERSEMFFSIKESKLTAKGEKE